MYIHVANKVLIKNTNRVLYFYIFFIVTLIIITLIKYNNSNLIIHYYTFSRKSNKYLYLYISILFI